MEGNPRRLTPAGQRIVYGGRQDADGRGQLDVGGVREHGGGRE